MRTTLLTICLGKRFLISLLAYCTVLSAQTQTRPNISLLAPGQISTPAVEYGCTFSPSGKEVYFARSEGKWGTPNMKSFIYYSKKQSGRWSDPVVVPFSGTHDDSDPHLTADGNRLYFISTRTSPDVAPASADIWRVDKDETGEWGEPVRLPEPLNSPGQEYSPRTDGSGHLYFASTREGGFGQGDLYVAKYINGRHTDPINLGSSVNSPKGEWNLEINRAGNLIIFEASERAQNLSPYGDLYISFKRGEQWTIPQNLRELNTTGSDLTPLLCPKARRLYYSSSDSLPSPDTNIYYTKFKRLLRKYEQQAMLAENH